MAPHPLELKGIDGLLKAYSCMPLTDLTSITG